MTKKLLYALLVVAMTVAACAVASWNSHSITLDNAHVSGRILKIPAPLACYWLSRSEGRS